ncbi:MAG: hypothetical protein IJA81_00175 [Akkermansia sp.]|nr:hypothetical protein [Akkermansia sp.]
MSDYYDARAHIEYTPQGSDSAHRLLAPGQLMLQPEPEREWESSNISADLVGADWGYEAPGGNARLVLTWEALVSCPTVAELERHLRRLELALNLNRMGSLRMGEALHAGTPTLWTEWHAVLTTCTVRRLSLEEAPALPGAWGGIFLSFRLTHPEEV